MSKLTVHVETECIRQHTPIHTKLDTILFIQYDRYILTYEIHAFEYGNNDELNEKSV